MKNILFLLVANSVSLAFIALAAWMIYLDNDGWGWPLALAFFSAAIPTKISTKDSE